MVGNEVLSDKSDKIEFEFCKLNKNKSFGKPNSPFCAPNSPICKPNSPLFKPNSTDFQINILAIHTRYFVFFLMRMICKKNNCKRKILI